MNAISYTQKISSIIENFNPNQLGIYFSLFLHLIILLFAIGLPDLFKPKPVILPNIIPIEIVNIAETTSISEKIFKNNNQPVEKKIIKQKKFNASENVEIKKLVIQEKPEITKKNIPNIVPKEEMVMKEKIIKKNIEEEKIEPIKNIESLNTLKIKPKIKPKLKKTPLNNIKTDVAINTKTQPKLNNIKTDVAINTKTQPKLNNIKTDVAINTKPQPKLNNIKTDVAINTKPQPKPAPDMSQASILKDLRNEKSNNIIDQNIEEEKEEIITSEINENNSENMVLSISEYDLLKQQLSSCWNAPAGAEIKKDTVVKISAKVNRNRRVVENSIRIVDTNIAKSNSIYGPITESAMRTLLKPKCTPLKLPEDKYNLWKNLTITFDYSIMKGYFGLIM